MKCPKCHQENAEQSRFCTYCGEPLEPEYVQNEDWNDPEDSSSKKKKIALTAGIVILCLALAAGGFWMVRRPSSDSSQAEAYTAAVTADLYTEPGGTRTNGSVSALEEFEISELKTVNGELWGKVDKDKWLLLDGKTGKTAVPTARTELNFSPDNRIYVAQEDCSTYRLPAEGTEPDGTLVKGARVTITKTGKASEDQIWGEMETGSWVILSQNGKQLLKEESAAKAEEEKIRQENEALQQSEEQARKAEEERIAEQARKEEQARQESIAAARAAENQTANTPVLNTPVQTSSEILPGSSSRYLSSSELSPLSSYELCLARNEIYARHGYIFETEEMKAYFGAQPWYVPTTPKASFASGMLSEVERANIQAIKQMEAVKGEYVPH